MLVCFFLGLLKAHECKCFAVLGYGSRKFVIEEFHSLKGSRCLFEKRSFTGFQGHAEEYSAPVFVPLKAMNDPTAGSQQSCCDYQRRQPRLDLHVALLRRCNAACASSGAGIGLLYRPRDTENQALVFANHVYKKC